MRSREEINAYYRKLYAEKVWKTKKAYRSTEEFKRKDRERRKAYHAKQPWRMFWESAMARCLPHAQYGARGIKCDLTLDQVKDIWFRDEAYNLERPSIDRIDTKGNYTWANVQFIELKENLNKVKSPYTRILNGQLQHIKPKEKV